MSCQRNDCTFNTVLKCNIDHPATKFVVVKRLCKNIDLSNTSLIWSMILIETMRGHVIIRDICKFLHRLIECLLGTKFI